MVYPTLTINQDDCIINIYDTEFDDNPILGFSGCSPRSFGILFQAFYNQYNSGYEDGWTDAESMLDDEQKFDC